MISTASPWWGIPLLSGALAFVGILLAQSITLHLERRRLTRDDRQRWDTERRRVYVAFLETVWTEQRRSVKLHTSGKELEWDSKTIHGFLELSMLASQPVENAALELIEKLTQNGRTVQGAPVPIKELTTASKVFIRAVQLEIGITPATKNTVRMNLRWLRRRRRARSVPDVPVNRGQQRPIA
ncbi:hypothetical protein AB0B10_15055 [Micromonospora arborensis]|uniref:hypothetical protein n=1 Tax=Micromonospora arborensis TaxID=2116518 RepID=UPI0033DB2D76